MDGQRSRILAMFLLCGVVVGCGGGGGSSYPPVPVPTAATATPTPASSPAPAPTVAAGGYWLFGTFGTAPSVSWVSADGGGRSYSLTSTTPTIGGSNSQPIAVGADASGAIYVLYTAYAPPAGTFVSTPSLPDGEVIQVFAPRVTGLVSPIRSISIPNFINNMLVEADGSILLSYAGTLQKLPPAATRYTDGSPILKLVTYTDIPANLVPADGPLVQATDGTLYCVCSSLPLNLGGAAAKQVLASYAPGATAPTTIAQIDVTGIYGPNSQVSQLTGLQIVGGALYAALSGISYSSGSPVAQLGAIAHFALPLSHAVPIQPSSMAITNLGTVINGGTVSNNGTCNISTLQGCTLVPNGLASDGVSLGTEIGFTFQLFSPGQSGPGTPLQSLATVKAPPIYVKY